MSQDLKWLQNYATTGCEKSFTAIVQQHHNLVYSAALRQVKDVAMAEEVTQAVFVILARKAGRLSKNVVLVGWLFRTTRFVANHALRDQSRRQKYEKEAVEMNKEEAELQTSWDEIAPVLDDAIARLGETDRHAILLRFFERKDLKGVGATLGTTEEAARKRIARALDKLHGFLTRRGAVLSTAALGGALMANAVQAAPATLLPLITATVASNGGSTATLILIKVSMKAMFYAKLQPVLSGAALLLAAGIGTLFAQQAVRAPSPRVLFQDNFEGGNLDQWTGNLHGSHSGIIVSDPLRPRNRVVTFTGLAANGDLFTITPLLVSTNQRHVLSFDYLGLAQEGSVPDNFGGFLGIATSVDDWQQGRSWLAGTDPSGITPPMGVELVDDGAWHHYEIDISRWVQQSGVSSFHLMLEDWRDIGGVAGDVYFDNIRLAEIPRPEARVQVHVTEVTACWESELYQNYQLQYRSVMAGDGWTNTGDPVAGNGGTNCVADRIPLGEPQRFYRVIKVP